MAALTTIAIQNPSTEGADVVLNGTTYTLGAHQLVQLQQCIDKCVTNCTGGGGPRQGRIPALKVGSQLRFDPNELRPRGLVPNGRRGGAHPDSKRLR